MKEYKKLQIIKHALKHYINRPGVNEKDFNQEKRVLNEIEEKVEMLKEKYNI